MIVVRNRGGQLLLHCYGSGSATLPEVFAFPVAAVVDNIALNFEDRILRVFPSPRDELKVGCHCENRNAMPFRATSPLIYTGGRGDSLVKACPLQRINTIT